MRERRKIAKEACKLISRVLSSSEMRNFTRILQFSVVASVTEELVSCKLQADRLIESDYGFVETSGEKLDAFYGSLNDLKISIMVT